MIQTVVVLVSILIFLLYKYTKSKSDYWKKRGLVHDKVNNGLGITWDYLVQDRAYFEHVADVYNNHPDVPVVGTMSLFAPLLVIRDPENIQTVMTGDFNTFNDRGLAINEKHDKLSDNVLLQSGVRWKLTRQKMTPLFTSSKLRNMYYIMDRSGRDFVDYLRTEPKEHAFDILTKYCSASIAASVFGIQTKSTMDSPLLDMARKVVEPSIAINLKFAISGALPRLFHFLRLKLFGDYEELFIGAIKKVLRAREQETTRTHDFADLSVMLQKGGTLRDSSTGYEIEPTDELLAAQAFFFFIAGVEPSATAMFFTLFELAKHPSMLKKLHEEVDAVFEDCNGNPTYEAVIGMEYLDMVLDEGTRMHPPIGNLVRKCTQDGGVLPAGDIRVEKGTLINIPVYALHHDPQYFPNPEKFIPERFSEEEKKNIKNYTFMPFGDGHRLCIGMRFARLQVKTGLLYFLRHFTIETLNANTKIKYSKMPVQVRPLNIDLKIVPRTNN